YENGMVPTEWDAIAGFRDVKGGQRCSSRWVDPRRHLGWALHEVASAPEFTRWPPARRRPRGDKCLPPDLPVGAGECQSHAQDCEEYPRVRLLRRDPSGGC